MATKVQNQLGFDEQLVQIPTLESALEERLAAKDAVAEARKAYDAAHEKASVEIAKLELPEDTAVRCGRFRITRSAVSARSVAFETKATSRVRITLLEPDAPAGRRANGAEARPPAKDDEGVVDLATHARRARDGEDIPPVVHP